MLQRENARFFSNTVPLPSIEYVLHSTRREHEWSAEETFLLHYRNQIQVYEEKVPADRGWEYYKKRVNPYEWVYTQKRYERFPESVCTLKPLSRSYFKMVEMLEEAGMTRHPNQGSIKTAHVCEGPGGFIEAICDRFPVSVAVAMTLKSNQDPHIPGWRRANAFLRSHRQVKIVYGEDQTGDIMKTPNQQTFIDYATHPHFGGKVDLFTADGGFDVSDDYSKQEERVFPLLLASTKIGLEVLQRGGMFVLKVFDLYRKYTMDLMYFLSYHFESWTLYKPRMSRPCNPEHYFIGRGFLGCTMKELDVMRLWCEILQNLEPLEELISSPYSAEFVEHMNEIKGRSFESQTLYLTQVFEQIDTPNEEHLQEMIRQNEQRCREWCQRYHVPMRPPGLPSASISSHSSRVSE